MWLLWANMNSITKLNPVKRSVHVIGQTKIHERYGPITTAHEPKLLKGVSLGFIR